MREKPKERPQGSLIEKTAKKKVEGKQICLKVNPQGLASVKSAFLPFRSSKNSPSEWLKTDPAADQNRGGIYMYTYMLEVWVHVRHAQSVQTSRRTKKQFLGRPQALH